MKTKSYIGAAIAVSYIFVADMVPAEALPGKPTPLNVGQAAMTFFTTSPAEMAPDPMPGAHPMPVHLEVPEIRSVEITLQDDD